MNIGITKTVRHPVMKLMIDFNDVGYERKDEWVDVTDDVLEISGSKEKSGRQLGSVVSDVATFTVDNIDKKFSNDNKNSPFYQKIKPNLRFRLLTGFKGKSLIPYASGYVEAFTPSWKEKKILIKTTDYFKLFKKTDVPEDSFQDVSWDELVNILCDHVGLPKFIVRHIPKTEFYYNYFKFEETDCFEALKGLMEVAVGEAYFEQEEFFVKTKLALDYKFDDVPDHKITVDELLDFDENVDSQTIINTVTLSSEYKTIAPLQVVFETPDNIVKVENEQIIYKSGNSIYVNADNLPLINNEENPISIKNITQGRTIYIQGHDPMTGKIDIHPESLANLSPNDVLAVSYSYQQLALLAGKQRKYTFSLSEEVDSINALDIAVWDEKGDTKRVYSENADTPNTVSRQSMTFDKKGNSVTLVLKNNYDSPITISTLQLRGYPIKVISPIEVFVRDLPSIEEYGKQEVSIQNNYVNNVKLAEKIAQYIVDNNKDNRKRISIEIAGYPEFTLDDISLVTEESSGTSHKFTNDRIDYSFSTDSGWSVRAELTELDSKPWVYESFKGESWEKTNPGTPDSDFLTDINANLIKNGGAELYTGTADYEDVGAISQKHIVPDYWHFTRTSGNATARIRDGGNLVLHGLHSFEITTSDGGSGYFEQIVNNVKTESTYILSFVASVDSSSGKASILQYDGETLLKSDSIDIKNSNTYELMISSLSKTNTLVIRIEKLEGAGSESLIFDKVKLENAKEKTPYIESEETSAVQIGQRYANSLTIGNNYGIEIFDENNTSRVRLGQYQPGKYGLLVLGGAIEVIGGLPEDQIDPEATNKWNNASTWIDYYADDNSLSPVEKRGLSLEWSIIKSEYDGAILQSNAYWEPTQKLPERDQLTIDYYKLYNYLFVTPDEPNGKPILDDDNMDNNSDINRAEYNTLFSNFYESLSTLHTLIVDRAKVIADNAEAVGQAAQQTAADAEAKGEAAAKAAEEAKDAATKAQADAASAVTSANNAVNTANKATQDAQDAIDKAQDGLDIAQDAISKAGAAVDTANTAKQVASDAATQASTAKTNAQTAMSNAQDAINKANAANDNANTREKSIIKSNTAPSNPATDQLWIDTSKTPQIMRRWNGSTWVDLSPTQASQIGAVSTTTYTTDITNINNTLSQKASVTTVNTLSGRVDSAETAITQNANAIASKADKNVVDTLKNTVDNHSTLISQNADAIALKANASTVDTLTGRVSTAEATLATQADQIAARITKTDADAKYATRTALTATANSLTSSISAVQTNLDNLQIGGRNLIRYSNTFEKGWAPFSPSTTLSTTTEEGKTGNILKAENSNADGIVAVMDSRLEKIPVIGGQQLTVSAWFQGNHTGKVWFLPKFSDSKGVESNPVQSPPKNIEYGVWYKLEYTFTVPSTAVSMYMTYRYANTAGTFPSELYLYQPKLEKGNKATDWSPAPEDLATVVQFNTLSQTLDSTVSRIGNAEGNISALQQTANSFATRISNAEGNISTLTQTAQGLQTAVSGKVDTTTYNSFVTQTNTALQSKLSVTDAANKYATQSQLTQTASSLTSQITSVQTNIDNLQVGGRNLAPFDKWQAWSGAPISKGSNTITLTSNGTTYYGIYHYEDNKYEPNTDYILTFKASLISGSISRMGGHSGMFDDSPSITKVYVDGNLVPGAVWTQGITISPSVGPTHTFEVHLRTKGDYSGETKGMFIQPNRGNFGSTYSMKFWDLKIEKGNKATDWTPAPEDMATQSQISQLSDNINLRVKKGDVINQINVSTEGILIDGKKVHITGRTTIDNAVIKDAMIQSMTANKLTAGTIDANVITVKNINASNIVTGTLDASKATVANIDASKITTGTLSAARIAAGSIDASKLAAGTITAASGVIGSLDASKITTGTLDAAKVSVVNLNADNIVSGTLKSIKIEGAYGTFTGTVEGATIKSSDRPYFNDPNFKNRAMLNDGSLLVESRNDILGAYGKVVIEDGRLHATGVPSWGVLPDPYQPSKDNYTDYGSGYIHSKENLFISAGKVAFGGWLETTLNIDGGNGSINFTKGSISNGGILNENLVIKAKSNRICFGDDYDYGSTSPLSILAWSDHGRIEGITGVSMITLDDKKYSNFYAGVWGEFRVTDASGTGTYKPVRASSFPTGSLAEFKTEITKWEASALDIINAADIYQYRLKDDVKNGKDKVRHGLVIGEGYRTPAEVIDGDGVEQYEMNSLSWKAIQELSASDSSNKERLSILEEQNNNLLLKVASLELELADIKQKLGDA